MDETSRIDEDLEQVLGRVAKGEQVTLHQHGQPVARVVPADRSFDPDEIARIKANIAAIRTKVSLGGLRFKDFIHEGHKY